MSESEKEEEEMQIAVDFVGSLFDTEDTPKNIENPPETQPSKQKKSITGKYNKKLDNVPSKQKIVKNPKKNLTITTNSIQKNYLTKQPDHTPSLSNNYLTNNDAYKTKYQNRHEKKLYQDKLLFLKNHINKLKMQEENLNKKVEQARLKEKAKLERQKEKEDLKQALLSADIDKRNELEEKKKYILRQKIKSDLNLKENQERSRQDKKNKFQQLKNERQIENEKALQKQQKEEAKIKKQIEKIKNERENLRNSNYKKKLNNDNDENNIQEEIENQKLKEEIMKLENEELKCIQSLRKTQEHLLSEPYVKSMSVYTGENFSKKFHKKKDLNIRSAKNERAQSSELSDRRRKKYADKLVYNSVKGKKNKNAKY